MFAVCAELWTLLALLSAMVLLGLQGPARAATPADRYVIDRTADTVADTRTGLVWQRLTQPGVFDWQAAKARCVGGFRLPSYKELLTLVDPTRVRPAIDPAFRGVSEAEDTPSAVFWSASPYVGKDGAAWDVSFADGGNSGNGDVARFNHVRCVR
jgi:hypothetical protein